jgi:fermentation-respiration switch protein FrsA (DUF1100 family)
MRQRSQWGRLLLFAWAIAVSGVVIGAVATIRDGALRLAHPSRSLHAKEDTPLRLGIPYQAITLTTRDGLKLAAWYTPPQNGTMVLVAHGYGAKRSAEIYALFARHGYGVLAWDMRAHGESDGELCTVGYAEAEDVETALDYTLSQPGVKHVAAWGESMGGVATILAAARRPEIEALVADSAFTTLEDELALRIPIPLLRPLVRFFAEQEAGRSIQSVRPVDQIGRLSPRPVFVIQGLADQSIPLDSGQRLYEAAGEPRLLWQEEGIGHVEMYTAQPGEYEARVIAFLDEALPKE